jgi:hypothetical protein
MNERTQTARINRTFVCENGDCLAQVILSATEEQYKARLYFAPTIDCPICSRKMYEVQPDIKSDLFTRKTPPEVIMKIARRKGVYNLGRGSRKMREVTSK